MNHQLTLQELHRWEDHGAGWRVLEADADRVTVELRTCYGEPVDVLSSRDRRVIDFVGSRLAAGLAVRDG